MHQNFYWAFPDLMLTYKVSYAVASSSLTFLSLSGFWHWNNVVLVTVAMVASVQNSATLFRSIVLACDTTALCTKNPEPGKNNPF
jgi:hypothetical protein